MLRERGKNMMSTIKPCIFRKGQCRQVETFYQLFGSYETTIHMQARSEPESWTGVLQ